MFEKRWNNLDFHEENGESIKEVQKRNIQALSELLINHENKRVIIGHHGTALARQYE
jgi:2,3-bisphosphoglycerate-dependent phosphoglycerate mutase